MKQAVLAFIFLAIAYSLLNLSEEKALSYKIKPSFDKDETETSQPPTFRVASALEKENSPTALKEEKPSKQEVVEKLQPPLILDTSSEFDDEALPDLDINLGIYPIEEDEIIPFFEEFFGVDSFAIVDRVVRGSPVYKAGIREGDLILMANREKVDSPESFFGVIEESGGRDFELVMLEGMQVKMFTYQLTRLIKKSLCEEV